MFSSNLLGPWNSKNQSFRAKRGRKESRELGWKRKKRYDHQFCTSFPTYFSCTFEESFIFWKKFHKIFDWIIQKNIALLPYLSSLFPPPSSNSNRDFPDRSIFLRSPSPLIRWDHCRKSVFFNFFREIYFCPNISS